MTKQRATRSTTQKRTRHMTLGEFKAWLAGVEELQPKGWTPNADQWKLIRAKINNIMLEPQPAHSTTTGVIDQAQLGPNAHYPMPPPSIYDVNFGNQYHTGTVDVTPAARAVLASGVPPTDGVLPIGNKPKIDRRGNIKTPNLIDTTDGRYASSFD